MVKSLHGSLCPTTAMHLHLKTYVYLKSSEQDTAKDILPTFRFLRKN